MLRFHPRLLLLLLVFGLPLSVSGFELQPLATRNLAPAVLGFGLPALGPAQVLTAGTGRAQVDFDLVSNFVEDDSLRFDGETYRLALAADYGIGADLELGVEVPFLSHQGGFLDGFIKGWHDTFGLPQGGRDQVGSDQLDYHYSRPNNEGFNLQSKASGVGDVVLRGAWQYWQNEERSASLALRTSLKLPTGRVARLLGSGSTDLALWLSGEQRIATDVGRLLIYGGGGGLLTTDGELLPNQRRNLVGLVNLGLGWQPWERLGVQLQFDGHTALYQGTGVRALDRFAGQLAFGGSFALGESTAVELAVVEDIIVRTAPDVVFHLALRQQF